MIENGEVTHDLKELLVRQEIENVLYRYVRAVDRADWDLLYDVYHEGAVDDHGGFKGGVGEFIEYARNRHRHLEYSAHHLSNIQIDFFGQDVAVVETYCQAFQRFLPGPQRMLAFGNDEQIVAEGSAAAHLSATLRYVDRFENRGGKWRIAKRTVVSEHIEIEQFSETIQFGAGRVVQQHDSTDYVYQAQTEAREIVAEID